MSTKKIGRRELIGAIGATGAAVAFGCGGSSSPTSPTTTSTTTTTGNNSACAVTPTETVGPYPSLTDLFRSDIREGKSGTLLALTIKVVNTNSACAPVSGANVEIWHVDAAGNYSQYGTQTTQTYLRGIQTTNDSGEVTFITIYPGWYQGRATHIYAEVTRHLCRQPEFGVDHAGGRSIQRLYGSLSNRYSPISPIPLHLAPRHRIRCRHADIIFVPAPDPGIHDRRPGAPGDVARPGRR